MLHTFIADTEAEARETVREPMKRYLASSISLVKKHASAWTAFSKRAKRAAAAEGDEFSSLSEEDQDALLEFSFERYFESSGLFGTPDRCLEMLKEAAAAGINEIACLIDFGVDVDTSLQHLEHLNVVRQRAQSAVVPGDQAYSLPALLKERAASHLQCTPSMAMMLTVDSALSIQAV